jgi:hypothetical protein
MLAKAGKLLLLSATPRPASSPVHSASRLRQISGQAWSALKQRVYHDADLITDDDALMIDAKPPPVDASALQTSTAPRPVPSLQSLFSAALPSPQPTTAACAQERPLSAQAAVAVSQPTKAPMDVPRSTGRPSAPFSKPSLSDALQSHWERLGASGQTKPRRPSTNTSTPSLCHTKVREFVNLQQLLFV